MATEIELRVNGTSAELVLVPPDGRPPTLDHATLDRLDAQVAAIEQQAERLRMVTLRSASPKFFCVGADLNSLQFLNADTITSWIEHGHEVFDRLERLPLPVIARVEGYALGGGLELALAADLILASEAAQLGQTEARLGFITGWGGAWRLPHRVGEARAKQMFFTGRIIPAVEARTFGLVEECLTAEGLEAYCRNLEQELAASSAIAVRAFKRLLDRGAPMTYATKTAAEVAASIECVRSADTQQRVRAFLDRKKKPAKGA